MQIIAKTGEPAKLVCDCGEVLEEDLEHGVFKCPKCVMVIPVFDVKALVAQTMAELASLFQALIG
jgi:hypothetical protein